MRKDLRALDRQMAKAANAISKELETRAIEAAVKISKQHPANEIIFCSAMGSFTWSSYEDRRNCMDSRDFSPPIKTAFEKALQDWGWNVIPAPIRVKCRNGKVIETLTDW